MLKKHTISILLIVAIAVILAIIVTNRESEETVIVTDFASCEAAGNDIMESYPRQCAHEGQTYTEQIDQNPDENQNQDNQTVEPSDDPFAGNARLTASEQSEIIGMTESQASAYASARGVPFRVVAADGEFFAVTMDYRPGRINATLENGVVVSITIE